MDDRVGGLQVDPNVAEWKQKAATNRAAMSKRERREAARTTAKYDLPGPWLKEAVAEAAEELGTSASQFAAFLLAWGMRMYMRRDAALMEQIAQHRRWTRSLRFEYDLDVPRDVKDEIVQVIEVW